jgi:hypothetical protein
MNAVVDVASVERKLQSMGLIGSAPRLFLLYSGAGIDALNLTTDVRTAARSETVLPNVWQRCLALAIRTRLSRGPTEAAVVPPGLQYPAHLRLKSCDVPTYRKMLVDHEYEVALAALAAMSSVFVSTATTSSTGAWPWTSRFSFGLSKWY